jgi:hypothetical protein
MILQRMVCQVDSSISTVFAGSIFRLNFIVFMTLKIPKYFSNDNRKYDIICLSHLLQVLLAELSSARTYL